MATANINIRMDENLKKETDNVRRNSFNAETRNALAEYDEMKTHPEKYKRYHSFSDLVKDVDNEA